MIVSHFFCMINDFSICLLIIVLSNRFLENSIFKFVIIDISDEHVTGQMGNHNIRLCI